jgi:monoamine oxidase
VKWTLYSPESRKSGTEERRSTFPRGTPICSYSYWKVGQYTLFSGSERERSGKCHFAGEHCSINYQGYMEGGTEEGARAVNNEILSDYKAGIFP